MTTPLELAELLEEGPRRAGDAFIASELRRLAQVEAEHAALLKAIMDAEPVAWCDPTNADPAQSVTFSKLTATKWPHIYTRPLYTLNGIKK